MRFFYKIFGVRNGEKDGGINTEISFVTDVYGGVHWSKDVRISVIYREKKSSKKEAKAVSKPRRNRMRKFENLWCDVEKNAKKKKKLFLVARM